MAGKSPFSDDWRDCLSAHFMHVIRTNDARTEPTLTGVLMAAGFTESELRELKLRATMHIDDVPADFVPDLEILQPPPVFAAVEVPAPVVEEVVAEEAEVVDAVEEEPPPPHDEDGPKQLSLF